MPRRNPNSQHYVKISNRKERKRTGPRKPGNRGTTGAYQGKPENRNSGEHGTTQSSSHSPK
jgi:hypothetical protein